MILAKIWYSFLLLITFPFAYIVDFIIFTLYEIGEMANSIIEIIIN